MASSANISIQGFETIRKMSHVGGQGIVYEAVCIESQFESVRIGDHVALKVMTVQDDDPAGVFSKLAERTAALVAMCHPNIVRYHGCFAYELPNYPHPIHVVVMEYLPGQTLRELLDKNPQGLDVDVAVRVIRDCLSALVYAEGERKIIHRDIKPGNIIICDDGTTKLIDFELARQVDGGHSVSTQGNLRGAFDYMAPDFLDTAFHGDEQSDVFSLAVCLHEALSGQMPYQRVSGDSQRANNISFHRRWITADGKDDHAVIQIDRAVCLPVANVLPVLERGLVQSRDRRYASFQAFKQDFDFVGVHSVWDKEERYDVLRVVGREGVYEVLEVRRRSNSLAERLHGQTLREWLNKSPHGLDADVVIRIFRDCLSALIHAARECKFPLRDITPGNILIGEDGTAKYVSLNLTGQYDEGQASSRRRRLHEHFDYTAPDFLDSSFRGDERSAIFSLAVCLHEALSGRTPYHRGSAESRRVSASLFERWNPADIKDARKVIRIDQIACVANVHKVLEQGLAQSRDKRYATFLALNQDFASVKMRSISDGHEHYDLLCTVGRGGYGEVFKARRQKDGLLVAIKYLLKSGNTSRFVREADLIQSFLDPRLVRFVDYFTIEQADGPKCCLVMEYLPGMPGGSVRDRLHETKQGIPFEETLKGFIRYAEGLVLLHERDVYHRDIKPSNLYLPPGQPERACIMDFGVARDANGTVTNVGIAPGTFNYMPPEVAGKDHRGDAKMDIYALGLSLYEALTNKPALPPVADLGAFLKRAAAKPSPVFDHPLVISNFRLHGLLVRMTDPDVSLREGDASRVVEALRDLLPHGVVGSGAGEALSKHTQPLSDAETALTNMPDEEHLLLLHPHTEGGTQKTVKLDEEVLLQQFPLVAAPVHKEVKTTRQRRPFPWRGLIRAAVVALDLSLGVGAGFAVWYAWPNVRERIERFQFKNRFEEQLNEARRECDEIVPVRAPDDYGSRSGEVRDLRKRWADVFASLTNSLPGQDSAAYAPDIERALSEYDAKALEIERCAQEQMRIYTNMACMAYARRPAVPAALRDGMEAAQTWERWAAVLKTPEVDQIRASIGEHRKRCLNNIAGEIVEQVTSAYQSCQTLEALANIERSVIQPWRKQADDIDESLYRSCEPVFALAYGQARKRIQDAQDKLSIEEKRKQSLAYLHEATAQARSFERSESADRVSQAADSLRVAICSVTNVIDRASAREAEELQVTLNKRLDFLRLPVPLIIRCTDKTVAVLWSQSSNGWHTTVGSAATDRVYPGALLIRYERPDYLAIGPTNITVKPGQPCELQAPSATEWRRGDGLIALEELEEACTKARWDFAEKALNLRPVLLDGTHSQRWHTAVTEVRTHLSAMRDGVRARVAALDAIDRDNFSNLAKLVWPAAEGIQEAPAVAEAQERLTRRLENWVKETAVFRVSESFVNNTKRLQQTSSIMEYPVVKSLTGKGYGALGDSLKDAKNELATAVAQWVQNEACALKGLGQRAVVLNEAKVLLSDSEVSRIMDVSALARAVDQELACCVLTINNQSGQGNLVRMSGVGEAIRVAAETSWTGRIDAARGEIEVSATANRFAPYTQSVSLMAGGWREVTVPKLEPLPGFLRLASARGDKPPISVFMNGRLAELDHAIVLTPDSYRVECRRPDYQSVATSVIVHATETNRIDLASLPWTKTTKMQQFESCASVWAKGGGTVTLESATRTAGLFPFDWQPEDPETRVAKDTLERQLVAWYDERVRQYVTARQRFVIDTIRLDYQVADLETGATRKGVGEKTECANPDKVPCPDWVVSKLSADVREALRGDGLPLQATTLRAIEISKNIHTIIFRPGGETENINDGLAMFAQIVDLHSGYTLNRSDLALAKYLYENHAKTLKDQIRDLSLSKNERSNRGSTARAIIEENELKLGKLEDAYRFILDAERLAAQ